MLDRAGMIGRNRRRIEPEALPSGHRAVWKGRLPERSLGRVSHTLAAHDVEQNPIHAWASNSLGTASKSAAVDPSTSPQLWRFVDEHHDAPASANGPRLPRRPLRGATPVTLCLGYLDGYFNRPEC
jgi:hypothetical protein